MEERIGLFAGSDAGGERAAVFYTLIRSAKMNGVEPEAYLREVLTSIGEHPITRSTPCCPGTSSGQRRIASLAEPRRVKRHSRIPNITLTDKRASSSLSRSDMRKGFNGLSMVSRR